VTAARVQALFGPDPALWRVCVLRGCLVAITALIAIAVPDFGVFTNLVGNLFTPVIGFLFPPALYLLIRRDQRRTRAQVRLAMASTPFWARFSPLASAIAAGRVLALQSPLPPPSPRHHHRAQSCPIVPNRVSTLDADRFRSVAQQCRPAHAV